MKTIFRQIVVVFLAGTALVPAIVPALHQMLEEHEHHYHATSSDSDQFHDGETDCNLCDYLSAISPVIGEESAQLDQLAAVTKASVPTQEEIAALEPNSRHLRGPPTA